MIKNFRNLKFYRYIKINLFFKSKNETIDNLRVFILSSIFIFFIFWRLAGLEIIIPDLNKLIEVKSLYSPVVDRSYFEFFQYLLFLWCSLRSLQIIWKTKYNFAWPIPLVYFYLFIDDFFMLHDNLVGNALVHFFIRFSFIRDLPFIRVKDFCEIIYWLIVLIFFIIVFLIAFRSSNKDSIEFVKSNVLFFIMLSFFGIFIDILIPAITGGGTGFFEKIFRLALYSLEEFGEMITISFAFLWLLNFSSNKKIKKQS